ncbi:formylglycine-generating enzyme family protein [Plesiocystis pacifica]|nr:SUMF1/EgtB/PvdO family nonheme iron enzyme [Plesiocystis pacifica]
MLGPAGPWRAAPFLGAMALVGAVLLAPGCSSPRPGGLEGIDAKQAYARCVEGSGSEEAELDLDPLLVEWPSTQRSALEAELHRGELIVVRYTGCAMEVLRGCEVEGSYEWTEVSGKHDQLLIQSAGDVWAKVPLGAAKLVGAVERYGALLLDMALVGQYAGPSTPPPRAALRGRQCEDATHVVSSLIVGAFELTEASGARVEAGVEVSGAGAGGGGSRHRGYYSSDGKLAACEATSSYGPPRDCRSLVQLELLPLDARVETEEILSDLRCPEGMAMIHYGAQPIAGAFCLDRSEVTVADYARCAADHTCSEAPASVDWRGVDELDEALHARYDELCNEDKAGRRKHPVNCLTLDQARAYCQARDKRLPHAHEWIYAAKGGEQQRSFPWGEDPPDRHLVNACGRECARELRARDEEGKRQPAFTALYERSDGFVGTAPVGSFPEGTGRWGLVDMAGNVWEWTSDAGTSGARVFGGSALSEEAHELSALGSKMVDPRSRRADLGLRCAADPLPGEGAAARPRQRKRRR